MERYRKMLFLEREETNMKVLYEMGGMVGLGNI